jgi:hypothetical protein
MVQIAIINGVYADTTADFRVSYPVNMTPTPRETGISNGYLRPSDGIVQTGLGPGKPRGGIVWRGVVYRVMGSKLVSVNASNVVTVLGDVGGDGRCSFDYSFDRLAITSGGRLYYWDGSALTQVTDPDLGTALTVIWIDGYFMTTDGEFLVVTELLDPTAVNPLKYGSSEADPDPVLALIKLRNEVYALNRDTIEVFINVGGDLFPFQRQSSAQVQKGCVGTYACCEYMDTVAFLGSGRNESPGIYLAANANAIKISTQEIDQLLLAYSEEQLSLVVLETRNDRSHDLLYVRLPDRCLVYDGGASKEMQRPVWHILTSSAVDFAQYRGGDFLWCYDAWQVADPASMQLGVLSRDVATHWGETVRWEFATAIVYNEGRGAIVAALELVALTGSAAFGANPTIGTSYTVDGVNWSQERFINAGVSGDRAKRLAWFRQGNMRNWRAQRFRGTSQGPVVVARLEAALEPLSF